MALSKIKTPLTIGLAMLAASLSAPALSAQAGSVVFDYNTVIDCGDTTWENYEVTVDGGLPGGARVTINCAHTFYSLRMINGGVITHGNEEGQGCDLTITDDVAIDFTSSIDVSGKGYLGGRGPGTPEAGLGAGPGGSYGGLGSGSYERGAPSRLCYGSFSQPVDMGSGGGNGVTSFLGGAGGGFLRLNVGGFLQVDGYIRSDGGNAVVAGSSDQGGGGGSGGSINISCQLLTGNGLITANGGNGYGYYIRSGQGGGGRIAIETDHFVFPISSILMRGGTHHTDRIGGAGTLFLKSSIDPYGKLYVNNAGYVGSMTEFSGTVLVDDLVVGGNAVLTYPQGESGLVLDVRRDMTVDPTATVNVSSCGNDPGMGPGAPIVELGAGPGASYGGLGSGSYSRAAPEGLCYGSFTQPTDLGSGGGNGIPPFFGGYGGGYLRVMVAGTLMLDGKILANGGNAVNAGSSDEGGGGGSGGSLYVTCQNLDGNGLFSAIGGNGYGYYVRSGQGGGGRIAVHYDSMSLPSSNFVVNGGTHHSDRLGATGTVLLKSSAQQFGDLYINNQGKSGAWTEMSGTVTVDSLTIDGIGKLTHPPGETGFHLDVRNDMTVATNSYVTAAGQGFEATFGPGTPAPSLGDPGAGGGFGSIGGTSSFGLSGGFSYGSLTHPVALGSGGGNGTPPYTGGAGGGAIKITVGNTLHVDGYLSADGNPAESPPSYNNSGGGGSGGSLDVTCNRLEGFGVIQSNGGRGYAPSYSGAGGGGAGGRIAVHTADRAAFLGVFSSTGGYASGGATFGLDGTIYYSDSPSYTLEVNNLIGGSSLTATVYGGTANTGQYLVYSLTGLGSFSVAQLGVTLGLDNPTLASSGASGGTGQISWNVPVPMVAVGMTVYLQACEVGNITNIVGAVIQ